MCKNFGECETIRPGVSCDLLSFLGVDYNSGHLCVGNAHYHYSYVGRLTKEATIPLLFLGFSRMCWWRPAIPWSTLTNGIGEFCHLDRGHLVLSSLLSCWTVYNGCEYEMEQRSGNLRSASHTIEHASSPPAVARAPHSASAGSEQPVMCLHLRQRCGSSSTNCALQVTTLVSQVILAGIVLIWYLEYAFIDILQPSCPHVHVMLRSLSLTHHSLVQRWCHRYLPIVCHRMATGRV